MVLLIYLFIFLFLEMSNGDLQNKENEKWSGLSHLLSLKDAHEYISNKKLHNLPHQCISTLHI